MTTNTISSRQVKPVSAVRKILALTTAEFILLRRNIVQLVYATIMPLFLPVILLSYDVNAWPAPIRSSFISVIIVFTVLLISYYNPLSALVNRREEGVLQRYRTGEISDKHILGALAIPGGLISLVMTAVVLAATLVLLNIDTPKHWWIIAVATLMLIPLFYGCALVTANFTRTAESAQMTSMPIILLMSIGCGATALPADAPGTLNRIANAIPSAPFARLIEQGWSAHIDQPTVKISIIMLIAWSVVLLSFGHSRFRWAKRV